MPNSNILMYTTEDGLTKIEATFENDTVWLSIDQMAELFQRDRSVIGKHVRNIFKEGELNKESVWAKFAYTASDGKTYQVDYYNLDVIISVGYRVKSQRGTQFRQWANKVLKEYLLKGYSINQRINQLENKTDSRLTAHDRQLEELTNKVDFFVRTSLPPVEGIFFDGQIFDAYKFASDLIKSARQSLVLIDNYVDESVLLMLSKRQPGVTATIYTQRITPQFQLDLDRHKDQYPPVDVRTCKLSHDRFLIVDDAVYHIGASLKDLGKKWFAFSKLSLPAEMITNLL